MYFQLLSHFSIIQLNLDWIGIRRSYPLLPSFFLKVDLLSVPSLHVNDSLLFLGIALSVQILGCFKLVELYAVPHDFSDNSWQILTLPCDPHFEILT